jgi:hypothetical protein
MLIPRLPDDAENLSAALLYAQAGIYLLPVQPGTKHPGSRVGDQWQDKSSTDPDTITAWYAGTSDGIAFDLGRSGLVVIDVDKPDLLPDWLATMLHQTTNAPYQSTRPDTPNRGHHVFAQPPGRRIGCGRGHLTGMGLDVKGAGGVIIAQPTTHPEGGQYQWIGIAPAGSEIPVLPTPLDEMLPDTDEAESAVTDAEVTAFKNTYTGSARPKLIGNWARKFRNETAKGNSRHDTMVSLLTAALEEARAGYYPARDVIDVLQEAFIQSFINTNGTGRRLSETRAAAEFRDMLPWSIAQAVHTPLADIRAKTEHNTGNDFSGLWTPPRLSLVPPPAPTPENPSAVATAPATPVSGPIVNGHKRVHLTLLKELRSNVPTWAWEYDGRGRIQRGTMAILAGRPGAGKSNAARWFAAGYSNGTMAGCWQGQPVNVAYISPGEESHAYVIKPGLDAAAADPTRICFPDMRDDEGNPTKLLVAAHRDFLIETFTAAQIRVVVVDPIMSTIPGATNINQNNETRVHVEPWAQLAEAIDGIVLGVCHFTKFPGNDLVAAINGSSAFGEVARSIFGFVREKKTGVRVFSQVKNSTGIEDLSLRYEITTVQVPTDLGGIAEAAAFTITGRSELTAGDVLDANADGEYELGGPGFAMQWLSEYLTEQGQAPAKQIMGKAKADQDISRPTLYRAMKQLGVVSYREGFPCTAYWRLRQPGEGFDL